MKTTLRRFFSVLLCAWSVVLANSAGAQSYPTRPIRVIVPFAPGGATDAVMRIIGPRLSEHLGQQVVVENRPGGAATIGMDNVAKSPADGYTLGVANLSFSINPMGVTTAKRDPAIPDVPSIVEAGVPGYQAAQWQGIVVRAGTPAAIITRLNQELVKSLKAPDMNQRFASVGAHAVGSTAEDFAEHIRKERDTWSKVIKAAGIRIE